MGRLKGIKWEKSTQYRPIHNIISSDFSRYVPQQWKYMEGDVDMYYIMSYEYGRMWLAEREAWNKRMFPENTVNVDIVKRYVQTFKNNHQPPKPEKKNPFRMKKFENIKASLTTKRAPGDAAMSRIEKRKAKKGKPE